MDRFFVWKYKETYAPKSYAFTDEIRLAIRPEELVRYFQLRAFGKEVITEHDVPLAMMFRWRRRGKVVILRSI